MQNKIVTPLSSCKNIRTKGCYCSLLISNIVFCYLFFLQIFQAISFYMNVKALTVFLLLQDFAIGFLKARIDVYLYIVTTLSNFLCFWILVFSTSEPHFLFIFFVLLWHRTHPSFVYIVAQKKTHCNSQNFTKLKPLL